MHKRRISVRGIIPYEGKLLLARLGESDATANPYFCTLGGKLEIGESLEDAIHREIIEETGITPVVGRLLFVQQFAVDGWEGMDFIFLIENGVDYIDVDLSQTTHGQQEIFELGFYDPKDISRKIMPEMLRTIDLDNLPTEIQFFSYLDEKENDL